jgi:hypothetical protein
MVTLCKMLLQQAHAVNYSTDVLNRESEQADTVHTVA